MQTNDPPAADAAALLAALRAVRLPRRQRCGSCVDFEADDGAPWGACMDELRLYNVQANDRCPDWQPLR
jgi:hypothetical protein